MSTLFLIGASVAISIAAFMHTRHAINEFMFKRHLARVAENKRAWEAGHKELNKSLLDIETEVFTDDPR